MALRIHVNTPRLGPRIHHRGKRLRPSSLNPFTRLAEILHKKIKMRLLIPSTLRPPRPLIPLNAMKRKPPNRIPNKRDPIPIPRSRWKIKNLTPKSRRTMRITALKDKLSNPPNR